MVANSQVAVMGSLSDGDFASIVEARLYLPKNWCDDAQRYDDVGIPKGDWVFKTKIDLAYKMILHQFEQGTYFDYVAGDGFYGNDSELASKVDLSGLIYMFDIHSEQSVYLEKPELLLPERKGDRGPMPKRLKVMEQSINLAEYLK